MPRLEPIADFLRRLRRDTGGNVALLLGLMAIPLIFAAGVGIDYSRAVQFKTQLQSIADAAALAGAGDFVSCASQSLATTAATNYVTKAAAALPPNSGITPTITPGPSSCSGSTAAFTMQVTLATTMPTTLMSLWKSSLGITTTATATNPVVQATIDLGNFTSSACDANSLYWYVVPSNGGAPASTDLTYVWSNTSSNNPTTMTISLAASQKIGFALVNTTGGKCGYGSNQYGGTQGSTQTFYSSMSPPSSQAYSSVSQDCSLQVIKGKVKNGSTTYAAPAVQCFSTSGSGDNNHGTVSSTKMSTAMTNAAPSCSDLAGKSYEYAWNDMGGTSDDYDYNDLVYTFSCSGGSSGSGSGNGTTTSGLTLTN